MNHNYCKEYQKTPSKYICSFNNEIDFDSTTIFPRNGSAKSDNDIVACFLPDLSNKRSFLYSRELVSSAYSAQYLRVKNVLPTPKLLKHLSVSSSFCKKWSRKIGEICFGYHDVVLKLHSAPIEKFTPSPSLVNKILENSVYYSEFKDTEYDESVIAKRITKRTEDYFSYLAAVESDLGHGEFMLTEQGRNRFESSVSRGFVDNFGLDVRANTNEVLQLLYSEIIRFLSVCARDRKWGTLTLDQGEIFLKIK